MEPRQVVFDLRKFLEEETESIQVSALYRVETWQELLVLRGRAQALSTILSKLDELRGELSQDEEIENE